MFVVIVSFLPKFTNFWTIGTLATLYPLFVVNDLFQTAAGYLEMVS